MKLAPKCTSIREIGYTEWESWQ